MGTPVGRRRQGGSLGYTAPIRIHRQGTCLHSGPETPDRRPLAAEWMRRREAELPAAGPWRAARQGLHPRRFAAGVRGGDEEGRQAPRPSACCPKLGTSSTDGQGHGRGSGRHADPRSTRVPLPPQVGGRQRYPCPQAPCPAALRFHELQHEATSRGSSSAAISEVAQSPCTSPGRP